MSGRLLVFTLVVALLHVRPARASPLLELIGDSLGQGGLNGRVAGPGPASVYFNPGLLPRARPGLHTGFFVLNDSISVSLGARDPRLDVPLSYTMATNADGSQLQQPSVPTAWLEEGCVVPDCPTPLSPQPRQSAGSSGNLLTYQAFGFVNPVFSDHLVFGVYGIVPLAEFTTGNSFFVDEREQTFSNSLHAELYGDRLTATSFAFGLGSQLTDRLSLGASLSLRLRSTSSVGTFVGNADDLDATLSLAPRVGVETSVAPQFALNYDLLDWLRLSATAHSAQQFDIEVAFSSYLPNGSKQTAVRRVVHNYLPWRFGLGAELELVSAKQPSADDRFGSPGGHLLSLSLSAVLGLWSQYINRQAETPSGRYAWKDSPTFGIGLRHAFHRTRSFLDAQYAESPVPLQSGRSNYVDNDRISLGAGIEQGFELFGGAWRVGIQGQLHFLPERKQSKIDPASLGPNANLDELVRDELPDDAIDTRGRPIEGAAGVQTNNPGAPGFNSAGLLVGGGVSLTLLL